LKVRQQRQQQQNSIQIGIGYMNPFLPFSFVKDHFFKVKPTTRLHPSLFRIPLKSH